MIHQIQHHTREICELMLWISLHSNPLQLQWINDIFLLGIVKIIDW